MSMRAKLIWILFFIVTSFCIALEPLVILALQETLDVAKAVFSYVVIGIIASSFLLFLASFLGRIAYGFFLSIAILFNLFSLKMNFYEIILQLPLITYWLLVLLIYLLISSFIIRSIYLNRSPKPFYFYLAAVIFISPLAVIGYTKFLDKSHNHISDNLEVWSKVKFKEKPNIYLLSYDSLIPQDVAADFLGISYLPYMAEIKTNFTEIPKSVSIHVPTTPSLNAIMRLDQKKQRSIDAYFAGKSLSILGYVMHVNNYRVVTGHPTYYFGAKGPFIDEFLTRGKVVFLANTTLCNGFNDSYKVRVRMFFACPVYVKIQAANSPLLTYLFYPQVYENQFGWQEIVVEHIKNTAQKNKPTLTFLYDSTTLGHTNSDYKHEDILKKEEYKNKFFKAANILNNQLEQIFDTIQQYDPAAIVIVFGDHGAYMSRATRVSDNPRFFYVDRHKILMAIMNTKNKCAELKNLYYAKDYATPSRLILDMISCLSGVEQLPQELIDFDENPEVVRNVFGVDGKNNSEYSKP